MACASTRATPKTGLRERKKIKTRQAIRHAAYRLFEQRGYDATTVEQIAAAAEVSASTFFRYFPTKEDVVLTDEYDPVIEAELLSRPVDEPIVESMRHAIVRPLREMYEADRPELIQRLRLVQEIPALRARMGESTSASCSHLVGALAQRTGREPRDLELRVLVGALLGGWQEAIMYWVEDDATEDLPDLVEKTPSASSPSA
ncbi:TetR family transcriptional regulator [Streptomyces sp. RB6PN25]|uniref:TetR family transcriptional regulator n=1 Tax=Streptomyces humicola TaxID=2953240 RepID=A0ABT1PX32_9ACTN|nr:TetR family transcriptional regulator [Streptomyces humicola]MCQ4082243.1 TetR family transcriptional regulator [Streptomyces humicola]